MAPIFHDAIATRQIEVSTIEAAAGRIGRPAMFQAKVNVKLGAWFNASKSYVDLDATGSVTGLLSAHNMELRMPSTSPAGSAGTYVCAEHNLVFQDAAINVPVYFAWYRVSGTQARIDAWEDRTDAAFIRIDGLTSGDGSIFQTEAPGAVDATLKINIGGVPYWIGLSSAHD